MTSLPDVTALLRRADWAQLSLSAEVVRQASGGVQRYFYRSLGVRPFHDGPVDMRRPGGPGPTSEELADQYESTGQLLLAPGGRYRFGGSGPDGELDTLISDGVSAWEISDGQARHREGPTGTTRPSRSCWHRPGCSPGSIWS